MNPWPDLRPILKGINWAIVGSVATRAYIPERMTKDLDIVVHQRGGETAIKRPEQAGYRIASRLATYMLSPDGTELDVLFGDYPWLKKALVHPRQDPAGSSHWIAVYNFDENGSTTCTGLGGCFTHVRLGF